MLILGGARAGGCGGGGGGHDQDVMAVNYPARQAGQEAHAHTQGVIC